MNIYFHFSKKLSTSYSKDFFYSENIYMYIFFYLQHKRDVPIFSHFKEIEIILWCLLLCDDARGGARSFL